MKRLALTLALTLLTFLGGEEARAGFSPGQWSDWDWGWPGMIPLPDTDGWWRQSDPGHQPPPVDNNACADIADECCQFDTCMCELPGHVWVSCPCC